MGNGSSIALHADFNYGTLLKAATQHGRIKSEIGELFKKFKTDDFEYILYALRQADIVCDVFGQPCTVVKDSYAHLRDALIQAVHRVHCSHDHAKNHFDRMAIFCKKFKTILTFNYDLTIYWMMLDYNAKTSTTWFKDCFLGGETEAGKQFRSDWETLRNPYGDANGATLVFWIHGSLMLARDKLDREIKIVNRGAGTESLLDIMSNHWSNGSHSPLFVSEGTSESKLNAIRRSKYLSIVHDKVLPRIGKSIAAYGFSFSDNDTHVLNGLKEAQPERLAISVFTRQDNQSQQKFCSDVTSKIYCALGYDPEIYFYDSSSPGCWINPEAS